MGYICILSTTLTITPATTPHADPPLLLLALGALSPSLSAQEDDFVGVTLFGASYSMNSTTGEAHNLMSTGFPNPNAMTTDGAGTYWAAVHVRDLVTVDPRTGFSQFLITMGTPLARGMAHIGGDSMWVIGNHERLEGLALSPASQLYAWDYAEGLCTMDSATGATTGVFTQVGAGFPGFSLRGMAYHDYTPSACMLLETTPFVGGGASTLTVSGPADGEDQLIFLQAMQRNTFPGECVSNILAEVVL